MCFWTFWRNHFIKTRRCLRAKILMILQAEIGVYIILNTWIHIRHSICTIDCKCLWNRNTLHKTMYKRYMYNILTVPRYTHTCITTCVYTKLWNIHVHVYLDTVMGYRYLRGTRRHMVFWYVLK